MLDVNLKAFIDNIDNNTYDIRFNPEFGHQYQFDLPAGNYVFSVSGMNGIEDNGDDTLGNTKVNLNGTFLEGPEPPSSIDSSDEFFILGYRFKI